MVFDDQKSLQAVSLQAEGFDQALPFFDQALP